jgi:hypothetical protein
MFCFGEGQQFPKKGSSSPGQARSSSSRLLAANWKKEQLNSLFYLLPVPSLDLIDVVKKDYGIEGGKMYLRKIVSTIVVVSLLYTPHTSTK